MSLLRRAVETRALTSFGGYGNSVPPNSAQGSVSAGVAVNDRTALQLTTFYACVRLIADSIASLPWDSYRKRDGQSIEVSPQPSLLRDPWFKMTPFDWKHQLVVSMAMRGNFFGQVMERDGLEYPTSIRPLHPDDVRREVDPDTGRVRVSIGNLRIPESDLFHVPAFTLPGSDVGLSPVMMAAQSLGLGLAAEQYGAKWFNDGASPSSVLEADAPLTTEQARVTQQQWIASHGGRRVPAVLSGGLKWKPITITPEESQFLETRQFQVTEIARLFGVPPHMIGDVSSSTSWGTGIEQQSIGFVTYTLRPWLTRIESALTRIVPAGQFVKFNVDALLRGDVKSRYEAYTLAVNGGWSNPDEIRALEDRPPIPGGAGQQFRQPLNFGPLGADPIAAPPAAPSPIPGSPDDEA